jgi:hypothetical protein
MNAVEIEEAISELAAAPFDAADFPRAFLEAFNNKPTTVKRLLASAAKNSDVEGGILQFKQIHLAVAPAGRVREKLEQLRASPKTAAGKVRFIVATDGRTLEAEDLAEGDIRVCDFKDFANHFGFFLPLAGITTVKAIKNNPIDIQATGRLNRLYVELLKDNPDWDSEARRHDLNQFMARLIFCFFAEDTGIFRRANLFTHALETYSDKDNAHEIIGRLFRVMDLPTTDPRRKDLRPWEDDFPYVNGGLFAGSTEVPRFSRIARSYLLHAGSLDWKAINPDIFGSMIQAVADDDERGELGMHYTSVPNILKVLNPLFLDDLREQLEAAGDNPRKLLNLRKRLARIRVFDPACGSGNFLVIAYKEMRAIEAEILKRRNSDNDDPSSVIPLKNFFGIEIKDFACEIARLSLLIAEYQCDVNIMGQERAGEIILPLKETGRIVCGNALRLDWLEVCPSAKQPSLIDEDLAGPTGRFALEAGDGGEWETYICGNPPYVGDKFQSKSQKEDLSLAFSGQKSSRAVDYIAGWFLKASEYVGRNGRFAFVSTNSIVQGVQVPILWPRIFANNLEIFFAHRDFYWSNNATKNANVICVIVGIRQCAGGPKYIFDGAHKLLAENINAYLIPGPSIIVEKSPRAVSALPEMVAGNIPRDRGNFMLSETERVELLSSNPEAAPMVRPLMGSVEFINGLKRSCLWIDDSHAEQAYAIPFIRARLEDVVRYRETGSDRGKLGVCTPHRFERTIVGVRSQIIVPRVSSSRREFLPVGFIEANVIISDAAQAVYDAPVYVLSLIASRMHLAWVGTTAGRMKSDYRYSTGVCYNSFPVPKLTEKNKADLTRCAEDILLAREHYFPATIADMYDPDRMDEEFPLVRQAHERNDEALERIYIGRRFKNDTERLEKLFELYTRMTKSKEDA